MSLSQSETCISLTNHSRSLTPLYQSCATLSSDPAITETLLHDHAVIGAQDLQGWQEVHQVSSHFNGRQCFNHGPSF